MLILMSGVGAGLSWGPGVRKARHIEEDGNWGRARPPGLGHPFKLGLVCELKAGA